MRMGSGSGTVNMYQCTATESGSTSTTSGQVIDGGTGTINLYNCHFSSTTNVNQGVVRVRSAGTINIYGGSCSNAQASAWDVMQSEGTLNIYGATLVNNRVSGTVTYLGTLATSNVSASGNIQLTTDNNILKFGTAEDATISFDGNSLNIVANAVTATDGLELTAGYFKITGGTDIRPSVDSTTAINIAQADGTDFVTFDTTNKRVGIGTTATTAKLTVDGVISATGGTSTDWNAKLSAEADTLDTVCGRGATYTAGNVGIGTTDTTKARVSIDTFRMATGASNTYVLTSDANGVGTWLASAASGVGGSGATNYSARFSAGTTLATGSLFDNGTNVGIGTTNVTKSIFTTTQFRLGTGTTNGYVLTANADGVGSWLAAGAGSVGGSGTTNYIPKFSAGTTLADSPITTDGTNVGIGMAATNPSAMLYVVKDAYIGAPTGNAQGLQISSKNIALTGDYNTMVGFEAGLGLTSGADNTYFGWSAGYNNSTGGDNTFIGYGAGYGVSGLNAKASNTAVGTYAMYYSTTAGSNVVVGAQAGERMTTGTYNTVLGNNAHQFNQTGTENTAIGYSAGYGQSGQTNNYNSFGGAYSAYKITTGGYNSTWGNQSLYNVTSGANNTAVGYYAGHSITDGSANVFIGYKAGENETGSNTLYIDNSNTTTPLIGGDFSTNKLFLNGNVGIGTTNTSSAQLVVGDNIYITNDCSALTFTDRTPYPETKEIAYSMVKSFEKSAFGNVVDKNKMSPLLLKTATIPVENKDTREVVMVEEKGRDLSMTVSALLEVVKDIDARLKKLEDGK
jgi:hypothetical protein